MIFYLFMIFWFFLVDFFFIFYKFFIFYDFFIFCDFLHFFLFRLSYNLIGCQWCSKCVFFQHSLLDLFGQSFLALDASWTPSRPSVRPRRLCRTLRYRTWTMSIRLGRQMRRRRSNDWPKDNILFFTSTEDRSITTPTRKSSPWGIFSDSGLNQSIKRGLLLQTFWLIDWLIDWLTIS